MKIGFTGTRNGMTEVQKERFTKEFLALMPDEFRHGDCKGSDAQAHEIVNGFCTVIIHPPTNPKLRAFKRGDIHLQSKEYLQRNRDIVDSCDILIACPKEATEQLRSGTWSCIRYARSRQRAIIIIYPDGSIYKDLG